MGTSAVQRARKQQAEGRSQSSRLESIGFVWVAGESLTGKEKQWDDMFERLEACHRQRGGHLAPEGCKEGRSLGARVANLRMRCAELGSR